MSGRRINIVVSSPLREKVDIHCSENMQLRKVMQAYADVYELDRRTLTFRIRGLTIEDYDTAHLLDIRPGNTIEVTDKVIEEATDKVEDEVTDNATDIFPEQA